MNVGSRKKNISTVIILVIVLLVPGFLYVALNRVGTNSYVMLPIYGERALSGKINKRMGRDVPDTVFHQVPVLSLANTQGDSVQFLGIDSVISVVHLFYTKDEGLSVALAQNLRSVVKRFHHNSKVKFYSISVDPDDSSEELANFAKRFNDGLTENWQFVSSSTADVSRFCKEHLLIDAMSDPTDSARFIISPNYVLIDSKHRIRGFYDINLKTEVDRLEDEIKVQLVEEIRNNPLKIEQK